VKQKKGKPRVDVKDIAKEKLGYAIIEDIFLPDIKFTGNQPQVLIQIQWMQLQSDEVESTETIRKRKLFSMDNQQGQKRRVTVSLSGNKSTSSKKSPKNLLTIEDALNYYPNSRFNPSIQTAKLYKEGTLTWAWGTAVHPMNVALINNVWKVSGARKKGEGVLYVPDTENKGKAVLEFQDVFE
jgi:hypothetical protein